MKRLFTDDITQSIADTVQNVLEGKPVKGMKLKIKLNTISTMQWVMYMKNQKSLMK